VSAPVAPRHIPVLGHVFALGRDPIGFLRDSRTYGDLVTFYLGTRPVHLVNSPELVRKVLVTEARHFRRGKIFTKARQLFGDGLATADDPVHMRQRRVVQPAFHRDRIVGYVNVMRAQVEEIRSSWTRGEQIPVDREMVRLTLHITAKALFRADLGADAVAEVCRSLSPVLNGLTKRTMMPTELLERIPTPANRRFDHALHRMITVVESVTAAYRRDGVDHGDLLSMMVTQMPDDSEVRAQVLNVLMAGTETTATTLAWLWYELARNPLVRQRVLDEVRTVLNGHQIEAADLPRFTYTDRVVAETLRLHTPVWLLTRQAVDAVRLGDVLLEPGAEVMVCLPALHRDPGLFRDPMRFDPDRADADRNVFLPFGAGGHKCVGDGFAWTEMITVVATVCQRWRLDLPPRHRVREVARAFLRPNSLPMIPTPV
jgi:cytochrome P450